MLSSQADNISVDLIAMLILHVAFKNRSVGLASLYVFSAMYSLKVLRIALDGASNVSASFDWNSHSQN